MKEYMETLALQKQGLVRQHTDTWEHLNKKQQVKMKLDAFSNKARREKYDLRLEVLKDSPEVQAKEIAEALKVLNKESEIMTPEKRVKEWMDFASKRQERVVNIVATRQL